MKSNQTEKRRALIYASLNGAEADDIKEVSPSLVRDSYLKHGIPIAQQIEICKKYCAENNIEVVSIYSDTDIPDTYLTKKEALDDMVTYCLNHGEDIDEILVSSIDRLTYWADFYLVLMGMFNDWDIRIRSVASYDTPLGVIDELQLLPLQLSESEVGKVLLKQP